MKSLDFAEALGRIIDELKLPKLIELLTPLLTTTGVTAISEHQKQEFSALTFQLNKGLVTLQADPTVKAVAESLGFGQIADPQLLSRLVTAFRVATQTQVLRAAPEAPDFWNLYSFARSAIVLHRSLVGLVIEPKLPSGSEEEELLQIDIIDYQEHTVALKRVKVTFDALEKLYGILCQHYGFDVDLRVAYADSGSDLAFAFLGKKVALQVIRSLFADGLKHIRFWQEEGVERRLATLEKGLDVVAKIRAHSADNKIDAEAAKRLEHAVTRQMVRLLGAGAKVAGVESYTPLDERQALEAVRDVKLLAPGDEVADA